MSRFRIALLCLVVVCFLPALAVGAQSPIKRLVLALYDSRVEPTIANTLIHRMAQMPLNHLGLTLRYVDIHDGLPPVSDLGSVRGVLTWFRSTSTERPEEYYRWAIKAIDSGVPFAVLGDPGPIADPRGRSVSPVALNDFLARLGLTKGNQYVDVTYKARIVQRNSEIVEYERALAGPLAPFRSYRIANQNLTSHLTLALNNEKVPLVVTGPNGGLVDGAYTHYRSSVTEGAQWRLNPFEFFRLVFDTDELPKPDPTTLSNRRVFLSHVEGSLWHDPTHIAQYLNDNASVTDVLYQEVFSRYTTLPVSISIRSIADEGLLGRSVATLRDLFQLPHVEAVLLSDKQRIAAVAPRSPQHLLAFVDELWGGEEERDWNEPRYQSASLSTSSAEARFGFLKTLLPSDKQVLLQQVGSAAQHDSQCHQSGPNGRFYDISNGPFFSIENLASYSSLAPYGVPDVECYRAYVGRLSEPDIFARPLHVSALKDHLNYSESPRRVAPLRVSYRMVTGQTLASLSRLQSVMDFVLQREVAPVATSHYVAMVQGFRNMQIERLAHNTWLVSERGALQTIRFDNAAAQSVDFNASRGVIGQRHYQGSLYVALDAGARNIKIVLRKVDAADRLVGLPFENPYLVESRWQIRELGSSSGEFSFVAQGFGSGEMSWNVGTTGRYLISVFSDGKTFWEQPVYTNERGLLRFVVDYPALQPIQVRVTRDEDAKVAG